VFTTAHLGRGGCCGVVAGTSWYPFGMARGFFSQGVVVLLDKGVAITELQPLLADYEVAREVEAGDTPEFGGPSLLVSYRPEVNGYVSVDVWDGPWPDHMGDSKDDAMLFAAWSMGHFCPLAYPGGLQRAAVQAWGWEDARVAVDKHKAAVRLRLSYVFGTGDDAKVLPEDCDPQHELSFLLGLAGALLQHPAALCYFNPNGEVLTSAEMLRETQDYHTAEDLPPLSLWCNVRLFNLSSEWAVMDCVGNWQLEMPDHEVAYPTGLVDPGDVDYFIRNVSLYILKNGPVVKNGDTMDGPGDRRWQARQFDAGLSDPPRELLRWLPSGIDSVPEVLLGETTVDEEPAQPPAKNPWWKVW